MTVAYLGLSVAVDNIFVAFFAVVAVVGSMVVVAVAVFVVDSMVVVDTFDIATVVGVFVYWVLDTYISGE